MKLIYFLAALAPTLVSSAYAQAPMSMPKTALMDTANHSGGWVGKTASSFALPDTTGKTTDIGHVIGTRPVVLIFYRGVWCPYCRSQMTDIGRHRAEFLQSGAAVYAISNEDAPPLLEMQKRAGLDFVTFLSDKTGTAAKLYAGLYPHSLVHQPGSFVIDKTGRIVYAYVNQDFRSRAATIALLQAVQKSR